MSFVRFIKAGRIADHPASLPQISFSIDDVLEVSEYVALIATSNGYGEEVACPKSLMPCIPEEEASKVEVAEKPVITHESFMGKKGKRK